MWWILTIEFLFLQLNICHLTDAACDWAEWQTFGVCSTSCGVGQQTYYRVCDKKAICLWLDCVGSYVKVEQCSGNICNGGWSNWETFGSCTVTCGKGKQFFFRHCNNPVPGNDGLYCDGDNAKYEDCNLGGCPGIWGCWKPVGQCSATCGNGTQLRVRECDNPAPTYGGPTCEGTNSSYEWCNIRDCPVFKWGYLKEMNLTKSVLLETMKEELNELQAYLTVDVKNTSAAIRHRTSAPDGRPSAASIGYIGIVLLSIPFTMMICCDCTRLFPASVKMTTSKVSVENEYQNNEKECSLHSGTSSVRVLRYEQAENVI